MKEKIPKASWIELIHDFSTQLSMKLSQMSWRGWVISLMSLLILILPLFPYISIYPSIEVNQFFDEFPKIEFFTISIGFFATVLVLFFSISQFVSSYISGRYSELLHEVYNKKADPERTLLLVSVFLLISSFFFFIYTTQDKFLQFSFVYFVYCCILSSVILIYFDISLMFKFLNPTKFSEIIQDLIINAAINGNMREMENGLNASGDIIIRAQREGNETLAWDYSYTLYKILFRYISDAGKTYWECSPVESMLRQFHRIISLPKIERERIGKHILSGIGEIPFVLAVSSINRDISYLLGVMNSFKKWTFKISKTLIKDTDLNLFQEELHSFVLNFNYHPRSISGRFMRKMLPEDAKRVGALTESGKLEEAIIQIKNLENNRERDLILDILVAEFGRHVFELFYMIGGYIVFITSEDGKNRTDFVKDLLFYTKQSDTTVIVANKLPIPEEPRLAFSILFEVMKYPVFSKYDFGGFHGREKHIMQFTIILLCKMIRDSELTISVETDSNISLERAKIEMEFISSFNHNLEGLTKACDELIASHDMWEPLVNKSVLEQVRSWIEQEEQILKKKKIELLALFELDEGRVSTLKERLFSAYRGEDQSILKLLQQEDLEYNNNKFKLLLGKFSIPKECFLDFGPEIYGIEKYVYSIMEKEIDYLVSRIIAVEDQLSSREFKSISTIVQADFFSKKGDYVIIAPKRYWKDLKEKQLERGFKTLPVNYDWSIAMYETREIIDFLLLVPTDSISVSSTGLTFDAKLDPNNASQAYIHLKEQIFVRIHNPKSITKLLISNDEQKRERDSNENPTRKREREFEDFTKKSEQELDE